MGQYFTHICEILKEYFPSKYNINDGLPILFFSNKEEGLFLIYEHGPFLTLGHSSYTNQSAPSTKCVNPKECLSLEHSSP